MPDRLRDRTNFTAAFTTLKLDSKQQENIFKKMNNAKARWLEFIEISFLNDTFKQDFKELILNRFDRLNFEQ